MLVAPGDYPQINALSLVTADLLTRLGMNLELVSTDWGTLVQRRVSKEPVEKGGWSIIHTTSSGQSLALPVFHLFLRANGPQAWFGWPEDAEIERLRGDWLDGADRRAEAAAGRGAEPPGDGGDALYPARLLLAAFGLAAQRDRRLPRAGDGVLEHGARLDAPARGGG